MVVTSVCGHNFIKKDDEEYCYKCGLCLKYDENGRFIMYEKTPLERIAANLNTQAQLYGAQEVPNAVPPQVLCEPDLARMVCKNCGKVWTGQGTKLPICKVEDTQPTGEWVVDFKKLYNTGAPHQKMINLISNTLQSALKKQREELIVKTSGMARVVGDGTYCVTCKKRWESGDCSCISYNQALSDVLEVLKDNNK